MCIRDSHVFNILYKNVLHFKYINCKFKLREPKNYFDFSKKKKNFHYLNYHELKYIETMKLNKIINKAQNNYQYTTIPETNRNNNQNKT